MPLQRSILWPWRMAVDTEADQNSVYSWGNFDAILWALKITFYFEALNWEEKDLDFDMAAEPSWNLRGRRGRSGTSCGPDRRRRAHRTAAWILGQVHLAARASLVGASRGPCVRPCRSAVCSRREGAGSR